MRAYVGLGANLGDREATLLRAVELLDAEVGVEVVAVSTLRDKLLPRALLVTPNLPEAARLLERPVSADRPSMEAAV